MDWPDAAFATGVDKVILVVSGTGLHPAVEEIQLVNFDPEDAVRLGLTALPAAAADAAGGLPISDGGGLDLDARLDAAVSSRLAASAAPTNFGALSITAGGLVDITQAAADKVWASAARTLTSFGTLASDVWAVATRVLTAGTNIVLAKGTGVTGFNDLSAAQVNAEADTALADVGVTSTVTGRIDVAISTRLAAADYTAPPSASAIADEVETREHILTAAYDPAKTAAQASDLATVAGYVDTEIATLLARLTATRAGNLDNLDALVSSRVAAADITLTGGKVTVGTNDDKAGYRLSATGVDDILDEVIEGLVTLRQSIRLANAANAGKTSGMDTGNPVLRDLADTKDRVAATTDADGNRTAVTVDLT